MIVKRITIFFLSLILFSSCGKKNADITNKLDVKMDNIAEKYVKLVLRIGQIDGDFVDAYYGPKDWQPHDSMKTSADSVKVRNECNSETDSLLNNLDELKNYKADKLETLRYRFLYKQLLAIKAKLFMIGGGAFSFDQESKALYDAEAPVYSEEHFKNILDKLNNILPGRGSISKRFDDYRSEFIIPKDKLHQVFDAAIKECRKRTLEHIKLPEGEDFKVEYVSGKPWSGYNWYKGNYFSLIQVNTDLPIYIDRAIDLAAHEGYPGHHVYNTLLEGKLVKGKGWIEFTVYPLFSPQSLIAEGTANFGIKMVLPGDEKVKFEKDFLFPLAGIDPGKADKYNQVLDLHDTLSFASNEAARNFLDGKWKKRQTLDWLEKYSLMSPAKAEHFLDFIIKYRSYVINYNAGEKLIEDYIYKNGGSANNPEKRWELFQYLLTTPQTPSGLSGSIL